MVFLEGYLVDLVPYDQRFVKLEHKWRNNESSFWAGGGERNFESRAQIEAMMQHRRERAAHNPGRGVWWGIQTKNGQPIGGMGPMWFNHAHRVTTLGAKIGEPDYWGGGYGSDALALVMEYTFSWTDVRKIWLMTTSMNARVQRQMEKFGFVLEARRREATVADGVRYDELAYGMLRAEWPGYAAMVEPLKLLEKAARAYGNADPG